MACGASDKPPFGPEERFEVSQGLAYAGSAGVTRFERSKAVTTSAVMPGSRSVDQPPSASCRGRRNLTARFIIAVAEGEPGSDWDQAKSGHVPR